MTPLRIAVASLALLLLAGCASTDERTGGRVAPQRAPLLTDVDGEYVAKVESIARRRYMDVVWVNPPTRPGRSDD